MKKKDINVCEMPDYYDIISGIRKLLCDMKKLRTTADDIEVKLGEIRDSKIGKEKHYLIDAVLMLSTFDCGLIETALSQVKKANDESIRVQNERKIKKLSTRRKSNAM